MEIVVKTSRELTEIEWATYTSSFDEVFHKGFPEAHFYQKYMLTIDGRSYHALLLENDTVVGGCTVIPYNYHFGDVLRRIGLVVDVFIIEKNRTDLWALFSLYNELKRELINNGIVMTVAIPNDIAYPYWKNVVKWKDIGFLEYHALPVKVGNVLKRGGKLLNYVSRFGCRLLISISYLIRSSEKGHSIRINREDDIIERQRYTDNHKTLIVKRSKFSYCIVDEEGIKTCYLIDFYDIWNKNKDVESLRNAIKYIYKNEQIDLIVFVGKLAFFQLLLFKVPYGYQPKKLYFTADILISDSLDGKQDVFNIADWDFGLFNYDVR